MSKKKKGPTKPRKEVAPVEHEIRTVEERLTSVSKALIATQHAVEDFVGAPATDFARRETAVRNFLSNGRSVTFMVQNLKHSVEGFDEWYGPIQDALKADPLAKFFCDERTLSEHERSSVLGQVDKIWFPVAVVSVQGRWSLTPSGIQVEVVGTTKDGTEVVMPSQGKSHILEGMPEEFMHTPLEVLMAQHLRTLEGIVVSTYERFGPQP